MRAVTLRLVAGLFSLLLASPLMAQTATTASMSGRITDAQGSVVPGATVTLTDRATTQARTGVSDPQGRYAFFTLPPGVYDLSATLEGFKTATVTGIVVEATRPVVQDVGLELGGLAEQVTVSATSETLVIKRDSSVGNTIERERLMLLPNLTRDAANLLALQPGATSTGFVTGARTDQATYSVDGIDVSDNVIGTTFRTAVPTPAESIEEFRMTVANPNVSFGRSSGAQVSFVTKRGTNSFHGSVYGYTQDENWNATSWDTNRLGLPKPPLEDNRFGGSLGGPIIKGKTFFFGLYEGRRDRGSSSVTRLVPTASLKQGLLQFRDASGAVQTINPRDLRPPRPRRESADPPGALAVSRTERLHVGRRLEHRRLHLRLRHPDRRQPGDLQARSFLQLGLAARRLGEHRGPEAAGPESGGHRQSAGGTPVSDQGPLALGRPGRRAQLDPDERVPSGLREGRPGYRCHRPGAAGAGAEHRRRSRPGPFWENRSTSGRRTRAARRSRSRPIRSSTT